jgi:hypothetical protein
MPRESPKCQLMRDVADQIAHCEGQSRMVASAAWEGSDDDSSTGTIQRLMNARLARWYEILEHCRYSVRPGLYRATLTVYERDLGGAAGEDDQDWLNDAEFLHDFRVTRTFFFALVGRISGHPVFESKGRRRRQRPITHQLLTYLFYLGKQASGANNPSIRSRFGIGRGTAELYKRRCVKAILSLGPEAVSWPDEHERREIATRIERDFHWVNCIGTVDGTLFPLTYAPRSNDASDYKGRKHIYTLTTMIVNDDKRKVRKYLSGFPGSAHDNRVYRSMALSRTPSDFFGSGGDPTRYFLLGDSAFSNSPTLVSAYKAPRNHALSRGEETFNTLMARPRITSEHTIGMLKARFPFLRSIPMAITNNARSVKLILRNIECCIILHNLLIDDEDEATEREDLPGEWYEQGDDVSDIDARSNDDGDSRGAGDEGDNDSDMAMEFGEVGYSQPFLAQHDSDERRQRCYQYMQDMGLIIT